MSASSAPQADVPTLALTIVFCALGISASLLALTGIGCIAAISAIAFCRFFGRPYFAYGIIAAAAVAVVHALAEGGAQIWSISFDAYWQTWVHGTFPVVTARIWLDPTEINRDRLLLASAGWFVGGISELILESIRNSRFTQLKMGGGRRRRAPIALVLAWIACHRSASSKGRTRLGTEYQLGRTVLISDSEWNKHCLILGTTGSGKTVTAATVCEASVLNGTPLVYVDGKGDVEFAERVGRFTARHERPFYCFNTVNLDESCAYNPLASGDYTSKADRLMTLRRRTEPYYEALAKAFLQTAFKIMEHENVVIDLVQASKMLSINALVALMRKPGLNTPERQALINEIVEQEIAEKTAIAGLRSELQYFANSSLGVLFDTVRAKAEGRKILNLEEARKEGAIVFFVLPPLLFQNAAKDIGHLVINDLKAVATKSRSIYKIFLDEFSVFASESVISLINQGRSFGLSCLLATQTMADMDAGAPELGSAFARQILGSVNLFLIHQLNEPDDAETLARVIGTTSNIELTGQVEGDKFTGTGSARQVREFVIHPDIFRSLSTGEAIVINKNKRTTTRIMVRKSKI